jgi:hypothetical protein
MLKCGNWALSIVESFCKFYYVEGKKYYFPKNNNLCHCSQWLNNFDFGIIGNCLILAKLPNCLD